MGQTEERVAKACWLLIYVLIDLFPICRTSLISKHIKAVSRKYSTLLTIIIVILGTSLTRKIEDVNGLTILSSCFRCHNELRDHQTFVFNFISIGGSRKDPGQTVDMNSFTQLVFECLHHGIQVISFYTTVFVLVLNYESFSNSKVEEILLLKRASIAIVIMCASVHTILLEKFLFVLLVVKAKHLLNRDGILRVLDHSSHV